VTARLPEYETEPTQYDKSTWRIEKTLQTKIHRRIDQATLNDEFEVSTGLLHRFFKVIRVVDAVVPNQITTANYEIEVETEGNGPPSFDIQQREV